MRVVWVLRSWDVCGFIAAGRVWDKDGIRPMQERACLDLETPGMGGECSGQCRRQT